MKKKNGISYMDHKPVLKNMHHTSRNSTVWPEAFERMDQFIRDTGLSRDIKCLS